MPYQHKAYSLTAVLSDETEPCLQSPCFMKVSTVICLRDFVQFYFKKC